MAKLIPLLDEKSVVEFHGSHGEQLIYNLFKNLDENLTKNWIVYYSYCFKGDKRRQTEKHQEITHIQNETDFLILAPNYGVFVFEIKGGNIICENGQLISVDKKNEKHPIAPYFQASSNYYTIIDKIDTVEHEGKILKMNNFIGMGLVGFPDINKIPDVGAISNNYDTFVWGMDLYAFITKAGKFLRINWPNKVVPTCKDIEQIQKKLNGNNYVYSMSKGSYIKSIGLRINDLTEEQTTVFQGLLDNPRCIVNGGAGTGKTVLCQFLFNKLVLQKKSVIYLTFNRLIANQLSKTLDSNSASICMPIMDFMSDEYKKINALPDNLEYLELKNYLFSNTTKLIENKYDWKKYDFLIIDEAQDIPLQDELVFFFENIVNGELSNGNCYIFYDDNQNLFNSDTKPIYKAEEFEKYRFAKFKLTKNCRNSIGVSSAMDTILKKDLNETNIKKIENFLENECVHFKSISNSEKGAEKIASVIDNLIADEVKEKQITLLFNSKKGIIFDYLNNKYKMVDYSKYNNKNISYSTPKAFKGLENDVIIYINNLYRTNYSEHYVAVSRAKVLAYIFDATQKS